MSLIRVVILASIIFSAHTASAVTLARDGQALCPIVVAGDATEPERTAAQELAELLGEVTGATFAVLSPADVAEDAPQILVGQSPRVLALAPEIDFAALGADSVVLRTVGDTLILSGGRPRGTLYAVNTFLEDWVGCRWWTSTESTIPSRPDLAVEGVDVHYTPTLLSREVFFKDAFEPVFSTRLKVNGHFFDLGEHIRGW